MKPKGYQKASEAGLDPDRIGVYFHKKSANNAEHDYGITEEHFLIEKYCEEQNLKLGWYQYALGFKEKNVPEPDVLIKITNLILPPHANTLVFPYEEENSNFGEYREAPEHDGSLTISKKESKQLRQARMYFELDGTVLARQLYGAARFRVIYRFRTHRKAMNFLKVLAQEIPNREMFYGTSARLRAARPIRETSNAPNKAAASSPIFPLARFTKRIFPSSMTRRRSNALLGCVSIFCSTGFARNAPILF